MSNEVLWRCLTETDFKAMRGEAAPSGGGGGAMHIALGVRTDEFPIDQFLNARGRRTANITAAGPGNTGTAPLTFGSNPKRRGGEWLIHDQYSHRHPAWSPEAGFRATYNRTDPPYILVFRVGGSYHARLVYHRRLVQLGDMVVPEEMRSQPKGITSASPELLAEFQVPPQTPLETFEEYSTEDLSEKFDPTNILDGHQRVLASVFRRLGQKSFRRKLLTAYDTQCAVTRCRTEWVLEAAHILPYRGTKTNAVTNGLLLRADIHTLFDLALISIEPRKTVVCVSSRLAGSQYIQFRGRKLALPSQATARPSPAVLEYHYSLFQP